MPAHPVSIAIRKLDRRFAITLRDDRGNVGTGPCDLALARGLHESVHAYRRLQLDLPQLTALGQRLLATLLLGDQVLRDTWHRIVGAAGRDPLRVTVEFEPDTEPIWSLPLELLADEQGHLFTRRDASLTRTLTATAAKEFITPKRPRVLLAWATPHSEVHFDPRDHLSVLQRVFGDDQVVVLGDATPESLEAELRGQTFDYLHLMVHGRVDWDGPLLVLDAGDGSARPTGARRFANALRDSGVRFAFLCACSSAELESHPQFAGIAATLVSDRGGDLAAVVAMQAPLLIAGSAALSASFYERLRATGDPVAAIANLRATSETSTWSVPILLRRPDAFTPRAREALHHGAAAPLAHFVGRADELASLSHVATDATSAPVIALLGIGGLGKTSILYHWLRDDALRITPPFERVASYCAYRSGASFRHFLEFLFDVLDEPRLVEPQGVSDAITRARELLATRRVLVAIDGLEAWLRGWKDGIDAREARLDVDRDEGPAHTGLDEFLVAFASLDAGSRLLLTSRACPRILDGRRIASVHSDHDPRGERLRGLRTQDGVALLRRLGVGGVESALEACVAALEGHPLLLTLLGDHLRGSRLDEDPTGDMPQVLRSLVETARDESPKIATELASFHSKLTGLLRQLEVERAGDLPLLRAIAACFADAPRSAIECALGSKAGDLALGHRFASLEKWGLLERYELDALGWMAIHPLVKQHFRAQIDPAMDRALGEWFAARAVPADSCTLRQAEPRIWAVLHFLRAGECDRCCALLFAPLAGGKSLCEWFHAWGYLEYEIELERKLLGRCTAAWEYGIRRSLSTNLRTLGRIAEADELHRSMTDPLPDETG